MSHELDTSEALDGWLGFHSSGIRYRTDIERHRFWLAIATLVIFITISLAFRSSLVNRTVNSAEQHCSALKRSERFEPSQPSLDSSIDYPAINSETNEWICNFLFSTRITFGPKLMLTERQTFLISNGVYIFKACDGQKWSVEPSVSFTDTNALRTTDNTNFQWLGSNIIQASPEANRYSRGGHSISECRCESWHIQIDSSTQAMVISEPY